jgi:hypothetical protein
MYIYIYMYIHTYDSHRRITAGSVFTHIYLYLYLYIHTYMCIYKYVNRHIYVEHIEGTFFNPMPYRNFNHLNIIIKGIVDVIALGSVFDLNLRNCGNILDVSALGTVHTLGLNNCANVIDVSALGTVYDLDLTGCNKVW